MWPAITLLFFLSGATSLIYETVWIRILSLAVGSTSAAMSLVLALFFLGLSAGSWIASRWLTKLDRPLRTYAILEGTVGIVGIPLVYALLHFQQALTLLPLDGALSWIGTLAKFLLVGIALSLPTMAMGATLPLVVRAIERLGRSSAKRSVSYLYAINTFGAVAGTLAAAFWLIPNLGVVAANHLAAALNVAMFVGGMFLDRKLRRPAAATAIVETEEAAPRAQLTLSRLQIGLVVLSGVCGFSSIASEVVWNKYLGIFIGNNIFGLGIVLSQYLLGMAVGSLALYAFLPRLQNPLRLFWNLLFALPLAIGITSALFNWVPLSAVAGAYSTGLGLTFVKCLLSALLLFPFTAILGALFPLTVHLLAVSDKDTHRAVGLAYSVNTVGAILGSCLSGLVLIPQLGSATTLRFASALIAMVGLGFWWNASERRRMPVALAAAALAVLVFAGNLDFRNIIKSAYLQQLDRKAPLADAIRYFSKDYEDFRWIREGETSIITLSHDPKDGEVYRNYLRLKTNGLNESIYQNGNLEELPRYEALLGLLPYLFTDHPKKAFVVGYGGGYTVDLMTRLPFEKVHVVELEKAILEAADYVHHGKNPIRQRANLDLTVEDARFVLAAKLKAPLDIIVSQPSHSWLAGAANLFTKEFFEIVKGNLTEQGVFSQWLNLYNMDVDTLQSILYTFYEVFPHGAVFSAQGDQEMILLGSKSPLKFNGSEAERLSNSDAFRRRLAQVPLNTPSDILAHFALDRDRIRSIAKRAVINTDVNAYAESRQSRTFYSGLRDSEKPQAFLLANYRSGFAKLLDGTRDWDYGVLLSLLATGQNEKFYAYLKAFEEVHKNDPTRAAELGWLCLKAQRYESAKSYLEKAFAYRRTTSNLNMLMSTFSELDEHEKALKLLAQNPALHDQITQCYRANAELSMGKNADTTMKKLIADIPGYTNACGDFFNRIVGDYFFRKSQYQVAIPFYDAYYKAYDHDIVALRRLSEAYLQLGEWRRSAEIANRLGTVVENERLQLKALGAYYAAMSLPEDSAALQKRAARPIVN